MHNSGFSGPIQAPNHNQTRGNVLQNLVSKDPKVPDIQSLNLDFTPLLAPVFPGSTVGPRLKAPAKSADPKENESHPGLP